MENKKILDIPLKNANKEEMDAFLKNKNAVMANVKLNWGLILGFSLGYFMLAFIALSLNVYKGINVISGIVIANKNGSSPDIIYYMMNIKSENSALSAVIFGLPGVLIILGFSLIIIHSSFIKEIERRTVRFWTTLPFSRNELCFSKYIFVIFSSFLVFAPAFILVMIFSAAAIDARDWFGDVLFFCIQFFLFISFINSIFFLTSNLLVNKIWIAYLINISILIAIACVHIAFILVYILWLDMTPYADLLKIQKILLGISKITLVINPIYFHNSIAWFNLLTNGPVLWKETSAWGPQLPCFGDETNPCYIAGKVIHKGGGMYAGMNKIEASIFPMITLCSSIGSIFLNNYIFSKKDFNI